MHLVVLGSAEHSPNPPSTPRSGACPAGAQPEPRRPLLHLHSVCKESRHATAIISATDSSPAASQRAEFVNMPSRLLLAPLEARRLLGEHSLIVEGGEVEPRRGPGLAQGVSS